jgi:hypothetical protein
MGRNCTLQCICSLSSVWPSAAPMTAALHNRAVVQCFLAQRKINGLLRAQTSCTTRIYGNTFVHSSRWHLSERTARPAAHQVTPQGVGLLLGHAGHKRGGWAKSPLLGFPRHAGVSPAEVSPHGFGFMASTCCFSTWNCVSLTPVIRSIAGHAMPSRKRFSMMRTSVRISPSFTSSCV